MYNYVTQSTCTLHASCTIICFSFQMHYVLSYWQCGQYMYSMRQCSSKLVLKLMQLQFVCFRLDMFWSKNQLLQLQYFSTKTTMIHKVMLNKSTSQNNIIILTFIICSIPKGFFQDCLPHFHNFLCSFRIITTFEMTGFDWNIYSMLFYTYMYVYMALCTYMQINEDRERHVHVQVHHIRASPCKEAFFCNLNLQIVSSPLRIVQK